MLAGTQSGTNSGSQSQLCVPISEEARAHGRPLSTATGPQLQGPPTCLCTWEALHTVLLRGLAQGPEL